MKLTAALLAFAFLSAAQTDREPLHSITAVRHWSQGSVTRVAVEVTGDFVFRTDRLHNPERVYFDILRAVPHINSRRSYTENLDDPVLKRVRIAETQPGITRVVLDLGDGIDVHTSQLVNPNRLIIELRTGGAPTATPPLSTEPIKVPKPEAPKLAPPPTVKAVTAARPDEIERVTDVSSGPAPATPLPAVSAAPTRVATPSPAPLEVAAKPESTPAKAADAKVSPQPKTPATASDSNPGVPKPARRTSSGDTSLVRALGLKIQRVVIDPGHGGHDEGTHGPHGLLEKDLVLDVSQRLGKLIEDRMGAEVIYTRSDDTFVPLEGRTALANERKADLFLSIHANSSPVPRITGVETYYLSLANTKEANDVAARENDAANLSVFELRDLIQKITLNDKVEESKEFAGRLQSSLFAFSARSFPSERNRGVKKAPFVVLIGARMPSVLAEIGFVSNTREEALLKRSDYRQKLAEALYRGVSRYADGLSHFQVAQNAQ
jgi:N-acetylmuramoyl-L-alanine amidase